MSDRRWNAGRVLLAQCGDRRAIEDLLAEIQEPLFRHVNGMTRNPALAEEALQETLMAIYRKLRWLREPELLRPWAYRIATRHALKVLRHERRLLAEPCDGATGDENVAASPSVAPDARILERLPALLDAVPPLSRAVLLMHYFEDMTLGEVATALGLSVGTVKSRLAYGLAAIRRSVAAEGSGRVDRSAAEGSSP